MQNYIRKILKICIFSMFLSLAISLNVEASSKPMFTEKKISVLKNQKQRIGLINNSKNVKWIV